VNKLIEWLGTWVMEPMMVLLMAGIGLAMFLGIPYGLYYWATYVPPETFSLRVDSWSCTKSHEVDRQICSKGCYWVRETVCDQWSAR
jgi:hypothetical protein